MKQVAPSWYERPTGVLAVLFLSPLLFLVAGAIESNVPRSSHFYSLGFRLTVCALFVVPSLVILLIYGVVRRHQLMKPTEVDGVDDETELGHSLLPLKVTSGVVGWPAAGQGFPKYCRLIGKLTVSNDGLSWSPLAPWRNPRSITVPWNDINAIRGSTVEATGWIRLSFGLSQEKYVREAIEECGMVWNRHPWDREVPDMALWAGEPPDWGLVSDDERVEP